MGAGDAALVTGAGAAAAASTAGGIFSGVTAAGVATAASAVGGVVSAVGQHEAGIQANDDAQMRARQAGLEAGQKQITIRENMLKALATQNAAAGVGGIGTGGSFGANVNRQIKQNQNDLLALNADSSAEIQQYNAQGANALSTGNIKAGASLLDTAGSIAKGL